MKRPRQLLRCTRCGLVYVPRRLKQQFCSRDCKAASQKGQPSPLRGRARPKLYRSETRACRTCSTPFRATRDFKWKRQIYCSHACYLKGRFESEPERRFAAELLRSGIHFVHQERIGRWCVDFLIGPGHIVEIDGEYWHAMPGVAERDARKTRELKAAGYAVLRISDRDVLRDVGAAISRVRDFLAT